MGWRINLIICCDLCDLGTENKCCAIHLKSSVSSSAGEKFMNVTQVVESSTPRHVGSFTLQVSNKIQWQRIGQLTWKNKNSYITALQ